jgi:hypothetical protein
MKVILLVLSWIAVFMVLFFILSLIGLLWIESYKEITSSVNWFIAYTVFIGIWVASAAVVEIAEEFGL